MNDLAERYVRLVLAVGEHDDGYVDAYYGPVQWQRDVKAEPLSLADTSSRAAALARDLSAAEPAATAEETLRLRHQYLTRQTEAVRARIAMLSGARLCFDDESKALYDAVAPIHTEADFAAVLSELDEQLPGPGALVDRYDAFRSRFIIPRERLDAVFTAAIDSCRTRTRQRIELPPSESFSVEYVTDKPWSGYNWYQGGYRSLIQVNTDLPIYVDRAIDLAAHEGYPGHHVYNALLEKHLLRDRGWVEFAVYPLFSPQSLIAEGTANYGIDVAYPRAERLEFERTVLFPAAGLDASQTSHYYDVLALADRLSYAGNEAARRYIDGRIDARGAVDWLVTYGLYARPRAEQRVRFIDRYRSYVINYNIGKDMVAAYIESRGGDRWVEFARLISSPRLPSSLS
jgi:hypothetical protein